MRGRSAEISPLLLARVDFDAGLGLGITPLVAGDLLLTSLALIGGAMLYASLTAKRAFAWLFVGLTFVMILLDKVQHPDTALADFARTRLLQVVAGTVACIVATTLSTVTLRRIWPAERAAPAARIGWHHMPYAMPRKRQLRY